MRDKCLLFGSPQSVVWYNLCSGRLRQSGSLLKALGAPLEKRGLCIQIVLVIIVLSLRLLLSMSVGL